MDWESNTLPLSHTGPHTFETSLKEISCQILIFLTLDHTESQVLTIYQGRKSRLVQVESICR